MALMNMELPAPRPVLGTPNRWMLDPLDDADDEETITLTLREVVRVTLVATEVGARFQRDGIRTDPMAWMLAPRRAFADLPPVEACITRSACARAVLIHGLGLDLNIAAHVLDALMDEEFEDTEELLEPAG